MSTRRRGLGRLVVEPVGVEAAALSGPIDAPSLLGRSMPLELEIGVGKGTFLLEQARARPDTGFVGIERSHRYWKIASDRLRRHGIDNARIVHGDAAAFLPETVPDALFRVVHVYFPDPWPKKRHHKRRLFTPALVGELARVLVPGGELRVVTDHEEYFEQIRAVVEAGPLRPVPYRPPPTAREGELVGTNFERKYRRAGRRFYALAAAKPAAAGPAVAEGLARSGGAAL